ncbi:MAG: DUF4350 domain-containing protein, partial [Fuerstiella sp.]
MIPSGLLACAVLVAPGVAGEFATLRLGHGGHGKVGKWLPVSATATGLSAGTDVELRAEFPDPRGDICVEIADSGTVEADGSVQLSGFFRSGRLEGTAVVTIADTSTDDVLCRSTLAFGEDVLPDPDNAVQKVLTLRRLDVYTLLTIGDVEGIEELLRNVRAYSGDKSVLQGVNLDSLAALPADARGLDAVDLLLLTDDFQTSPEQTQAIRQWVRDGGHLFISSGGTVSGLVNSELGAWIGDRFEIQETPLLVRRFSPLEAFVPGASRIQTNLNLKEGWPVAAIRSRQTTALVDSLDGPIIGSQSIGGGVVTIVAVDLNQLPFNRWTSLPEFYEVLFFGEKLNRQTAGKSRSSRISQSGVSDLATQLLAAVDAAPEVGTWSTWAVMAMLVAWLILIGPLDYLLVTRFLQRPHFTWFTFPLFILGGVMAVVSWAGHSPGVRLQQLDVVDVSSEGIEQFLTARTWMSVSAPETMKADLTAFAAFGRSDPAAGDSVAEDSVVMNTTAGEPLLSWTGRAEDVFGAMYRQGGIGLGRQSFQHDGKKGAHLTKLPLLINGSRAFEAVWHQQLPNDRPLINSELSVSGFGMLNGTFSHNLPGAISNWIIVHGNRAYRADAAGRQL